MARARDGGPMDARALRRLLDGTIGVAIGAGLATILQVGARESAPPDARTARTAELAPAERPAASHLDGPAAAIAPSDESVDARTAAEAPPRAARDAASREHVDDALEGSVADAAGSPIAGATVSAVDDRGGFELTTTGRDGRYLLARIAACAWAL